MAMRTCPGCSEQIGSNADTCPKCGERGIQGQWKEFDDEQRTRPASIEKAHEFGITSFMCSVDSRGFLGLGCGRDIPVEDVLCPHCGATTFRSLNQAVSTRMTEEALGNMRKASTDRASSPEGKKETAQATKRCLGCLGVIIFIIIVIAITSSQ